jgi:hypothetical protein
MTMPGRGAPGREEAIMALRGRTGTPMVPVQLSRGSGEYTLTPGERAAIEAHNAQVRAAMHDARPARDPRLVRQAERLATAPAMVAATVPGAGGPSSPQRGPRRPQRAVPGTGRPGRPRRS